MNKDNLLEMSHIVKTYPGVRALDDVSFSVLKGEVHALMGENGAGKSTLMKILSGNTKADSGSIFFDGKEVHINSEMDSIDLGISMIYQEVACIPTLSIMENIYCGRHMPKKRGLVDWAKVQTDCEALMKKLDLNYDPHRLMQTLSVADVQMIEIVKAISFDAKLIIMDEPTSALTEAESEKLFGFIRNLKKNGITVIIITHKLGEVFKIADRVTILRDGKYVGMKNVSDIDRNEMISMMAGRDIKKIYPVKAFPVGAC